MTLLIEKEAFIYDIQFKMLPFLFAMHSFTYIHLIKVLDLINFSVV